MSAKTPYIGSKISLISKAEIRYEGVLYAVDTKEATVTLAKVRSFGTEDRQVPKPIPPRAETYEFIIFRGSDIKDLHVSEIPAKTEEAPQDPAIVSATSQAPPTSAPAPSDPPPPSSSHPLLPPSQPPTYSPFPPAPGGFSPFGVPYFKPQVMMGGGAPPPTIQRPPHIPPPPTAPHTIHPLPPSSHPPFPPFIPGQLPIPLSQKSPFAVPNPPSSTAPIVSTIMKPSPGTAAEGKTQSPVASSTPQTASGIAAKPQTSDGTVTPAQTTPQAASESESPLARMNPVPPPSQVTQAPPPSLLSHVTAPQDPTPVPDPSISQTIEPQPMSSTTMEVTTEGLSDTQKPANHGKAPLISDPPPNAQPITSDRRSGSGVARPERGQERGRARGGRKNLKAGPRGSSRGSGSSNHQEPAYRYENDFDFESANAQFNKEMLEEEFKRKLRVSKGKALEDGSGLEEPQEIEEEENEEEDGGVGEEMEPGEFYDKSKSFFDSISCENPAGSGNRRTNWNEERELNTETFGVSSVNRLRQGRGRGRWRGRGRGRGGYGRRGYYGRGGYRGGRGGQRDGGRGEPREDRPPRGRRGDYNGQSSGYYRGSGGYRGQGRRGRGGERSKSGTAEHSQREATAGGEQQ